MQPPTPTQLAVFFLGLLGALALSVLMMAWIVEQYRQGRQVLPYQPRRPVPWRGIHVVVLVVCFVLAPSVVHLLLEAGGWKSALLVWLKGPSSHPKDTPAQPWPKASIPASTDEADGPTSSVKSSIFGGGMKASGFPPPAKKVFSSELPDDSSLQTPLAEEGFGDPQEEWAGEGLPFGRDLTDTMSSKQDDASGEDRGHPIEQLLRQGGGVGVWLVVVLMALVGAPVGEEWMFRGVLQGWLEKLERGLWRWVRRRRQRRYPSAAEAMPVVGAMAGWPARWFGAGPILLTSLLFAGVHFRVAGPPQPADELLTMMVCQGLGNLLTLLGGMAFLKLACGARAADFGWSWSHLRHDVLKGLGAYVLVVGPLYALMILTKLGLLLLDWDQFAPDPVPLFLLSGMLGLLYFRTHRLAPSVVLHMAFNATGLAIFWLFFNQKPSP